MYILFALFQCFLYCSLVSGIFYYVFSRFFKEKILYDDFIVFSSVCGFIFGIALFFLLCFSSNTQREVRTTSEVVSENNLVNLKLVSGQNSDFYMFVGSGEGHSSVGFTYFYYIEEDGKYKPQKIDMNNAVFADLSNESDITPRVVTTKITKAQYSKCENSRLCNILHIDLSNDWTQESGFIFFPPVDEQIITTFYIPKDKISKNINPNIN